MTNHIFDLDTDALILQFFFICQEDKLQEIRGFIECGFTRKTSAPELSGLKERTSLCRPGSDSLTSNQSKHCFLKGAGMKWMKLNSAPHWKLHVEIVQSIQWVEFHFQFQMSTYILDVQRCFGLVLLSQNYKCQLAGKDAWAERKEGRKIIC